MIACDRLSETRHPPFCLIYSLNFSTPMGMQVQCFITSRNSQPPSDSSLFRDIHFSPSPCDSSLLRKMEQKNVSYILFLSVGTPDYPLHTCTRNLYLPFLVEMLTSNSGLRKPHVYFNTLPIHLNEHSLLKCTNLIKLRSVQYSDPAFNLWMNRYFSFWNTAGVFLSVNKYQLILI